MNYQPKENEMSALEISGFLRANGIRVGFIPYTVLVRKLEDYKCKLRAMAETKGT